MFKARIRDKDNLKIIGYESYEGDVPMFAPSVDNGVLKFSRILYPIVGIRELFSGHIDEDGKEIYHDDIIHVPCSGIFGGTRVACLVQYYDGGFMVGITKDDPYFMNIALFVAVNSGVKIIGDSYLNEALLLVENIN